MRILLADDDAALRHGLGIQLQRWGYDPILCATGDDARQALQTEPPLVAILDRSMPGADGLTLCREIRDTAALASTYVILLTAYDSQADVVSGLQGGADEYITKPFDWAVLRARIGIGVRIATLQQNLAQRVADLQGALDSVRQLSGLLPICAYCKRIRNDGDYWQQLESYLAEHAGTQFSHGICPACYERARRDFDQT